MRAFTLLVLMLGALTAGGRPSAPASAFDPRDFGGIWQNREDQFRSFDPTVNPFAESPPLKEPWLSEWHTTSARVKAGEKVWDPDIVCLPPGMPRTMNMSYPFEVVMSPKRVTILAEYFNETRRIFMNGRPHPSEDDLEPTFRGDSIGHWEGKTLVIDTIGVRYETVIDLVMVPHSDQLHIIERGRRIAPNELEWTITLIDPVVLASPWTVVRHFVRASPDAEIREYVCAENNRMDEYVPTPDDAKYGKPDPRLKTRP